MTTWLLTTWLVLCLRTVNGGRGGEVSQFGKLWKYTVFSFVHTNLPLSLPLYLLLLEFDLARLHVVLGKHGGGNGRSQSMQSTFWNTCTGHRAFSYDEQNEIINCLDCTNSKIKFSPSAQVQCESTMLTDNTNNPSFIRKIRKFEKERKYWSSSSWWTCYFIQYSWHTLK